MATFIVPSELQPLLQNRLTRAAEALAKTGLAELAQPAHAEHDALCRLLLASDFALTLVERDPTVFQSLWTNGHLQRPRTADEYPSLLAALPAPDEAALMQGLRRCRQQEMLRWIWRDANSLTPLRELTQELSWLADASISRALDFAHAALVQEHGEPIGESAGLPQRLCVIAMGKLGAEELNLSSDIDLIFSYPEAGDTAGPKVISNQEFFLRLGQRLVKMLDQVTADGFVFRVDMRLRPWGEGSALVSSFAAMESYYEQHGREWERYALIKARICAGDIAAGQELMRYLHPFVFRRYIDFGVFEALREMKAMIASEVKRKGMAANIKLGSGGIREVEFIAQVFQLVRGGIEKRLQQRALLPVLQVLTECRLLPAVAATGLAQAYGFLRLVEHRLQMLRDQQTQTLPTQPEERLRLAASLGFADWEAFLKQLDAHRELVEAQFRNLVVARDESYTQAGPELSPVVAIWKHEKEDGVAWLAGQGFQDASLAEARLQLLRQSRTVVSMPVISRQRLDKLMPLLLAECIRHEEPDVALERCLALVESILRRTAYMMLLVENRAALERLVDLCAVSPWIAAELRSFPVLLDELLNAETLFAPPQKAELVAELRQQLLRLPQEDLEAQMETLRIFKKGHVLRVAASDLKGTLPLMKVSDYLTWIAEAVLEDVLWLSWRALTHKHGTPTRVDGTPCDPDFIILGYGKLGGIELGYGSDLDLVFIHDGDPAGETDGPKPLDNPTFFARLGQKIIHFLSMATPAGTLYEVDMRLRPSGNAGMLVSSLTAFGKYQRQEAWTWEHQALVRARVVAGDSRLAERFAAVRQQVLTQARDGGKLREEVGAMRQKMLGHLSSAAPGHHQSGIFALKQDRGGIVDIEFMVQYGVLAWAHEYPELTRYPDNVRILEGFATLGLLPGDAASQLKDAYLQYRARSHRLALSHREANVKDSEFHSERRLVSHWWQALIESTGAGPEATGPAAD
jgi:glutamate-ammonia-ligase adenylyltransferase